MTLEHYDERFGDTYVVHFDGILVHKVMRYVDRIGRDPIRYDRVEDLPSVARGVIEKKIHELLHPKK